MKNFTLLNAIVLLAAVFTACNNQQTGVANEADIDLPVVNYIEPDPAFGFSLASTVEDIPLAFTNHIFPFDSNGNLVGPSNVTEQLDQVIQNVEKALKAGGSDLSALVRIHLYLKDDAMTEEALGRLKSHLPEGTLPAITVVSGEQARPGVMVSMDVVGAAAPSVVKEGSTLYNADGIFRQENRSDVAILAPGRKIFISGQAERGEDLTDATQKTMVNLFATLAYLGARAEDVVQIKAFIGKIADAEAVEEKIASFFRHRKAPSIISVEWLNDPDRVEIELVASAPALPEKNSGETVSYYAPAWMTQATTYSRVVDIHRGGMFFTSGLYGDGEKGQDQAYNIFKTINDVLDKVDSNYDHLVKATYYPSNDDGRQGFVDVRPEFYNPQRPPAASLIRVRGIGRERNTINVDLIGAIPEVK